MSWSARLETSWQLLRRSLQVIQSNPRLLLFPVVGMLSGLAFALFFLAPVLALGVSTGWDKGRWEELAQQLNAVFYAYGVLIYLVSMFVGTFFNVAFYNEIIRALAGEPVSLAGGLRFAFSRIRAIFMWSLLAATVGLVIRAIEERLGWLGRVVMGLVGTVWSVAAVFAIPVIIRRGDSNPIAVLRDSAATLKRTWGESLIGFLGIRLGVVAFLLVSLVFGLAGFGSLLLFHSTGLFIAALLTWLVAMIIWSFLLSVATDVYRCALYVYASEGVIPGPFTAEMMTAAWKVKKP